MAKSVVHDPLFTLDEARASLKQFWGHDDFRKAQVPALEAIAQGDDVLVVLPTGGGKSALYQVPATLREGCTLVVSPLIALMKDQVDDLARRGIPASFVNSHVDESDANERLGDLQAGAFKLFYVSPERLKSRTFRDVLLNVPVNTIAVDESHCHVKGTQISTLAGTVPVEDIRPGDMVLTRNGPCQVKAAGITRVGSRRLVEIHTPSGKLVLTDDHPVFVFGQGFIRADQVQENDAVMQVVPKTATSTPGGGTGVVLQHAVSRGVAAGTNDGAEGFDVCRVRDTVRSEDQRKATGEATVLLPRVLEEAGSSGAHAVPVSGVPSGVYADAEAADMLPGVRPRTDIAWIATEDAPRQSNATTGDSRQGISDTAGTASSAASAGREWEAAVGSALIAGAGIPSGFDRLLGDSSGQVGWCWEALVRNLPRGLGVQVFNAGGRDRRSISSSAVCTEARSSAGCTATSVRVVRVTIHERTSAEGYDAGGYSDQIVYSLTVDVPEYEQAQYYANGILVHNCASRWGHAFRPSYMRIHEIVDLLSKPCAACGGVGDPACGCHGGKTRPQIVAVTATATGDIEDDIARALGMDRGYTRVIGDPVRPNFDYAVLYDNEPFRALKQRVRSWDLTRGRYVVYGGTRKLCEILCKSIAEQIGMSQLSPSERRLDWKRQMSAAYEKGRDFVAFYHAGMKRDDSTAVDMEDGRRVLVAGRESVQDAFKSGRTPVVVATCAFGMGIDIPNIREVVHFGIPGCLEDYAQEVGRGGRDGLPATAMLLHNDKSVELRQRFIDLENPPYELYPIVWDWLHTKLQPGQLLRLSAAKIAFEISGRTREEATSSRVGLQNVGESDMQFTRKVEIYEGQVTTILSVMESCGLVRRIPAADGTEMSVNVPALQAAANGDGDDLPEGAKALAEHLWRFEVEPRVQQFPIKRLDLTVDKDDLANATDRSLSTINRQLATLTAEKIVVVAPTFTGNTTEIRQYGVKLDDHLPIAQIEAKRRREQARLAKMLQYANSTDRRAYLREYFLKGVGEIPASITR